MEGEIVVFKTDVCLRAFWHSKRKKKNSQSKGFKENQSLLSLFCMLSSSWRLAMARSIMPACNLLFLCSPPTHAHTSPPHAHFRGSPYLSTPSSGPGHCLRAPALGVGRDSKSIETFLDHVAQKGNGLLMRNDGKKRGNLGASARAKGRLIFHLFWGLQ